MAKSQDKIAHLQTAETAATAPPSPSPQPPTTPATEPTLSEFPATLTTSDGQTYSSVKLVSHDAARVTILDSDGGATLQICSLTPEVQRFLGYDPEKAKSVETADEAQDSASQKALEQEREEADQKSQSPPTPSPSSSSYQPMSTSAPASAPAKLSADEIASIKKQIQDLQADISFMQGQEAKLTDDGHALRTDGSRVTSGGYPDKILQERSEISDLQNQLNQQ